MKTALISLATGMLLLMPARAQEEPENPRKKQLLNYLRERQKEAAERLDKQLATMSELIEDLRGRGDNGKADLLEKAIAIINSKEVQLGDAGNDQLADLRTVMNQMTEILNTNSHDTDRVQDLSNKVIDVLNRIVATLTNESDVSSIEEREAALKDIREETARLAQRQAELKKQTRSTMPRTEAEKTARAAAEELRKLRKQMADLDRRARMQLAELERAREWSQAINEMLQRQQRIHDETAVRAGKADRITPQINDAIAELEALARAAQRTAEAESSKASLAELARDVKRLGDRQQKLADEIASRSALERTATELREGRGVDKETARDATRAASGTNAAKAELEAALRNAAERPDDKAARDRARKAVDRALKRAPTRPTLRRDQEVLVRDIERALMQAPEGASEASAALNRARKSGDKAARQLAKGTDARKAADTAAAELKKAAQALQARAARTGNPKAAQRAAADRQRATERAKRLAQELHKLADKEETQAAGLKGLLDEAKDAAERAADEMQRASEAARSGDSKRARDEAKAAQGRTERAIRELRAGMEERHDLARRQGKLSNDLSSMAQNGRKQASGAMGKAAQSSQQAKKSLQKRDFDKAGEQQRQVLDTLQKLKKQADAAVAKAAQKQAGALQRMQDTTAKAAQKTNDISRKLRNAARSARENDARRRLDDAAQRTQKAEQALRRSLGRLREAMPKSAEQDRKEAQDEMRSAERSLRGLREAHRNPNQASRQQMKRIGERQKQLEQQVKLLEERLKRLKEKSGAQRMQDAQSAMRQAGQQLQQGEPDEAERSQDRAEKSLREAQKELEKEERRYRNLRQYELLFKLKEELKGFRRTAQAHRESLVAIDAQVRDAGRVTRHINRQELRPLARKVKVLARDVADKSGAVEKERAIVYTYILKGCAGDLKEVEAQLSMKEVGLVPQEMLGDVVRRFDMAIRGLERNLRQRQEDQKKQDQQGKDKKNDNQANNGKPLLVPADAEVRMVMVLQKALNQEREDFFAARPNFGERTPTATEKARLERLYHQQGSLAELFDSLRQALVGQQEKPLFPEDDSEGDDK